MSGRISVGAVVFLLLFSALLLAQEPSGPGTVPRAEAAQLPQSPSTMQTSPPQAGNDLSQMRDDLNKMESLNMNMSSEIEFLHDQNLQILLRTNSQMWTVLIRDLRRQLARQEQLKAAPPAVRK
jgi:hypothetical protein